MTHAPADSTLYRMILRGQIYISLGRRLGSMELGVSATVPRTFFKAVVGGLRNFLSGAGRGRRVDLLVVDVPVIISDKFQQSIVYEDVEVPQIQFIDRVVDLSVVLQRRVPTVQTVQKTGEIPQLQFLDKVDDARCCTTTGAGSGQSRKLWRFRSCSALTRWTTSLLCRSSCRLRCLSSSAELDYDGSEGFFQPFWPFFALLWVVPELSAIFRSPRWRRVLCHRGLLHKFILRAC